MTLVALCDGKSQIIRGFFLGLYSLSGKTSYRKISWSLEAARFGFKLFQSLWNLAGTSAALLPRCLSNFRAIRPLQHPISRLRDFTRFGCKTSYRLGNRGPEAVRYAECWCFFVVSINKQLTHWSRVTQICVSKLTVIGSGNGLSPGRCQAIIWTYAWILSIGPMVTNFRKVSIKIRIFSFKKVHFEISTKWRPFCLGINVLRNHDDHVTSVQ